MMSSQETYLEQIELELKKTPSEYLPALLTIIHAFRESVCADDVAKGFETSWQEMLRGEYQSVDALWDGLEL